MSVLKNRAVWGVVFGGFVGDEIVTIYPVLKG